MSALPYVFPLIEHIFIYLLSDYRYLMPSYHHPLPPPRELKLFSNQDKLTWFIRFFRRWNYFNVLFPYLKQKKWQWWYIYIYNMYLFILLLLLSPVLFYFSRFRNWREKSSNSNNIPSFQRRSFDSPTLWVFGERYYSGSIFPMAFFKLHLSLEAHPGKHKIPFFANHIY